VSKSRDLGGELAVAVEDGIVCLFKEAAFLVGRVVDRNGAERGNSKRLTIALNVFEGELDGGSMSRTGRARHTRATGEVGVQHGGYESWVYESKRNKRRLKARRFRVRIVGSGFHVTSARKQAGCSVR